MALLLHFSHTYASMHLITYMICVLLLHFSHTHMIYELLLHFSHTYASLHLITYMICVLHDQNVVCHNLSCMIEYISNLKNTLQKFNSDIRINRI